MRFISPLGKLAVILSFLFSSAFPAFAQEAASAFPDVPEGHRNFVAIQYLARENLIQGYEDGTFHPERSINRAEALTILFKALKPKMVQSTGTMAFADVEPHQWFYATIEQAYLKGVINGYPDKLFHPERNLNKAEALKIALLLENRLESLTLEITEKPYSDVEIDAWFAFFAQASRDRGLFTESRSNGGELLPHETLNRGQFAEFIYRLLQSRTSANFGRATFYSDFLKGFMTSSGEMYQPNNFTAAHPYFPFGTRLRVKNLANGKEVEVIINDRGPFATGVHVDLSKTAFSSIASLGTGIINIEYTVIPGEI